jgi:hypothetical protein
VSGPVELVTVEGKNGRRRRLRIIGRRQEGGYMVLELAPQQRRCYQGGCLRLVDVPCCFCRDHGRETA